AGRDEGVAGVHDHLQPGASGNAAGRGTTRGGDRADQFRGCVALATAGTTGRGGAAVAGEPGATGAGGTPGEKAAAQVVQTDDQAAGRVTQSLAGQKRCGLT